MASNDKTVFDPGATVRESSETILESGSTLSDGGTTMLEAVLSDAAGQAETAAKENIKIHKGATILDTYRVESDAIEGGMGSVWQVRHTGWNVDLAMKRPQPKCFSTEKSKADFIHECEAWINLGLHPNIVSCYYVREISGTPTIFSEWMEGGSLENAIRKGTIYEGTEAVQWERLLDIIIQFARGLHYAHETGLIHQDVKPDNVLLTKESEAKVADFGLAKARTVLTVLEGYPTMSEAADSGKTILSPSGGYTPAYCSMEQMDGKALTRRTDIYSWAVSVMELYLGARPWANGVVAGLSCRNYFEQTRVSMPDALKDLLAQCLESDPLNRPHDFGEIEAALQEIYTTQTGSGYPRPKPKAAADTADSLNNRALSMLDLSKSGDAERAWETALETAPNHLDALYNQGLYLWRLGKITDTTLALRLKTVPENGHSLYLSALIDLERGDVQSAKEKLTRALAYGDDERIEALLRSLWNAPPLVQTVKGAKGSCVTIDTHTNTLIVYEKDKRGFSLYDFDTGTYKGFISGEDAQTGLALAGARHGSAFWSSGKDALVRYSLSDSCPTDFFENPHENMSVWSFALNEEGTKALGLVRRNKSAADFEVPHAVMWNIERDKTEFDISCLLNGKVFLSPDAEFFAAVSAEKKFPVAEVWSSRKREKVLELKGHTRYITGFDVNKDFSHALTISRDGTLKLWNVTSGECLKTFPVSDMTGNEDVRFLPGCRRALITNSGDQSLMRVIDLKTGRVHCSIGSLEEKGSPQVCISIYEKEERFAVAYENGDVQLWRIPSRVKQAEWSLCTVEETSARLASEREFEVSATAAERAMIELDIAQVLSAVRKARGVSGFANHPRCMSLLFKASKFCRIKGLENCWKEKVFEGGHYSPVRLCTLSPDDCFALSACGESADQQLLLWDTATGEWLWQVYNPSRCFAADFSPDGKSLLAQSQKTLIRFEIIQRSYVRPDGKDGRSAYADIREKYETGADVTFAKYHPDGRRFLSAHNSQVQVWQTGAPQALYKIERKNIRGVAISIDGDRIAIAHAESELSVFEFETGNKLYGFFSNGTGWPCFSPDGQSVALAAEDGSVSLYRLPSGQILSRFDTGAQRRTPLCFAQDGRFLFTGGEKNEIIVWSLQRGKKERTLMGHSMPVTALSQSSKNSFLLSASEDMTLIRWAQDWEYEFPGLADMDEGAMPYVRSFAVNHPEWTEAEFQGILLKELQLRGFGWLRAEGVKAALLEITKKNNKKGENKWQSFFRKK